MGVFESSTFSLLCSSNQHWLQLVKKHMSSVRETASFTLGLISVIVWIVAEIPQIITNYRAKSAEGLSITFLVTWIIADLFNLFGCMLEPATLPTQLYMAVLYTLITVALGAQAIYYGHKYPPLEYKRQLKHSKHGQVETSTKVGRNNSGVEKASDADQRNEFDDFNRGTGLSSPIPLPARAQKISTGRELFYQSARYLSKSHTPTAGSILAQKTTPSSPILHSIEENLLGSAVATQSAPALKIKNTLCLLSTLTFLGGINLLQSLDRRINPMVSNPRQQFVIYVGRKLFQLVYPIRIGITRPSTAIFLIFTSFLVNLMISYRIEQLQVSGDQLPENSASGSSGIGTFLGWVMALIYLGGRLPQICLNIKRGHVEGLNPLMFLFALIGNGTYVASILVSSLDWSRIRPNLPWLVDAGGCVLLDCFILMQFVYFRCQTSHGL